MLKGEIWFEVIVIAHIEYFAIPHSPILVITQSISFHFILAQAGAALFMFFRGPDGRENEGMFLAETFADVQHVGE